MGPPTVESGSSTAERYPAMPNPDGDDQAARHLQVLGLPRTASWDEIRLAHGRLVADLTPGPEANHRNVALARQLLTEVNRAYDSLRAISSVA